jgi:hypothetical protein
MRRSCRLSLLVASAGTMSVAVAQAAPEPSSAGSADEAGMEREKLALELRRHDLEIRRFDELDKKRLEEDGRGMAQKGTG